MVEKREGQPLGSEVVLDREPCGVRDSTIKYHDIKMVSGCVSRRQVTSRKLAVTGHPPTLLKAAESEFIDQSIGLVDSLRKIGEQESICERRYDITRAR